MIGTTNNRNKAPAGDRRGLLFCSWCEAAARGHRAPRAAVGVQPADKRAIAASMPSVIEARSNCRNWAGSSVSASHSSRTLPRSAAASSRKAASRAESSSRSARSLMRASRALGLDLAISVSFTSWPWVPSDADLAMTAARCKPELVQPRTLCTPQMLKGLYREQPNDDGAFGSASRTTGPHHFAGDKPRQNRCPHRRYAARTAAPHGSLTRTVGTIAQPLMRRITIRRKYHVCLVSRSARRCCTCLCRRRQRLDCRARQGPCPRSSQLLHPVYPDRRTQRLCGDRRGGLRRLAGPSRAPGGRCSSRCGSACKKGSDSHSVQI